MGTSDIIWHQHLDFRHKNREAGENLSLPRGHTANSWQREEWKKERLKS